MIPEISTCELTFLMAIMDPQRLRARACECRSLSLDGEDMQLKAALVLLAVEFDHEASQLEAQLAGVGRERISEDAN